VNRSELLARATEQAERLEKTILSIQQKYAEDPEAASAMVGPYRSMLESVRAEIDSCLGLKGFPNADLVLKVESSKIGPEGAPSQLLVDTLESFRKALASTFVRVSGAPWAGQGRYSGIVRGASNVTVLGLARGSVRIAVDLPPLFHRQTLDAWVTEEGAKPQRSPVRAAVDYLLQGAEWAASDRPEEELERVIPDAAVRKEVMTQVRNMSPSPKGDIEALEIEGGSVLGRRTVRLTRQASDRARTAEYPGKRTRVFEDSGILKRITVDLDRPIHDFELRERPGGVANLRGDFPDELRQRVLDMMKLGRKVRVRGILEETPGNPSRTVLHLEDFEGEE
jgi:hypothetical protein